MIRKLALALTLLLAGCSTTSWISSAKNAVPTDMPAAISSSSGCSPMLGWLGGICILGGMVLLVITKGSMGWRPVIGGLIFIGINYALYMYGNWFFLPVAIATGAISLAWSGKIVWKIVNDNDLKLKEFKL
jgi:predicted lipid-binding transport protein (Tim44 family)